MVHVQAWRNLRTSYSYRGVPWSMSECKMPINVWKIFGMFAFSMGAVAIVVADEIYDTEFGIVSYVVFHFQYWETHSPVGQFFFHISALFFVCITSTICIQPEKCFLLPCRKYRIQSYLNKLKKMRVGLPQSIRD